jgi:RanBP1 domain/NUP50 (Nucleoporin 50 kDa)/HMG (high mobility group) box
VLGGQLSNTEEKKKNGHILTPTPQERSGRAGLRSTMKRGAENQLRREDVEADDDEGGAGAAPGSFATASASVLAARRRVRASRAGDGGAALSASAPPVPKFSFGNAPKVPAPVSLGAAAPKTAPKFGLLATGAGAAAPKLGAGATAPGSSGMAVPKNASAAPGSSGMAAVSQPKAGGILAGAAIPKVGAAVPKVGGAAALPKKPMFSFASKVNESAASLVDSKNPRSSFSFGANVPAPKVGTMAKFGAGVAPQSFGSVGKASPKTSFSTGFTFSSSTTGAIGTKDALASKPSPVFGAKPEGKEETEDSPPTPEPAPPSGPAQGEENEECVQRFRAKLFVKEGASWADKGIGQLKVMRTKTGPSKTRFVMRREKSMVVMLNAAVTEALKFGPSAQTKNAAQFMCRPVAAGPGGEDSASVVAHAVKVGNPSDFSLLCTEVETALSSRTAGPTGSVSPPAAAKPTPAPKATASAPTGLRQPPAEPKAVAKPAAAPAPKVAPKRTSAPVPVTRPVAAAPKPVSGTGASELVHDRPVLHTLVKGAGGASPSTGAPATATGNKRPAEAPQADSEDAPPAAKKARPGVVQLKRPVAPLTVNAPKQAFAFAKAPAAATPKGSAVAVVKATPPAVSKQVVESPSTPKSSTPSRDSTPFLKFCSSNRRSLADANPDMPFVEVAKLLAAQWRALTTAEQESYAN